MTKLFEPTDKYFELNARVSDCGAYRYTLTRAWGRDRDFVLIVGLNPSTADAVSDDPTIRRCVGFTKREGYERLVMMNLFAFRATQPVVMKRATDPVGPDNDRLLVQHARRADLVIAAWGAHGSFHSRDSTVIELLWNANVKLWCLGRAKTGHPRHPLMLRRDAPMELFSEKRA